MAHIKPTSSDSSPLPLESQPISNGQKLAFALVIIAAIGCVTIVSASFVKSIKKSPTREENPLSEIEKGLNAWIAQGPNQEREARKKAAQEVLCPRRDDQQVLSFRRLGLFTLPPEMGKLSHLKMVFLGNNQISSLPPEFWNLSKLEALELSNNQLISLPREIARLSNLIFLHLKDNRLTALPSEICQLAKLEALYIENNRLTSLPEGVVQMQSKLMIFAHQNPLSLRVIQNLQQLMHVPSYNGPKIHYSMPRERIIDNRPLDELMQELAEVAGQPPFVLRNLIDHSENIRKWLVRLSTIGDYKNKRIEFAGMIYQAIALAEAEADFRDSFLGCIDEAESTCGDRMALSVLRLDILYKIAKSVKEGDLKELAYLLGHGSWALSELETIARNKVPTLRLVDEIEVYLAYPVKLKAALKLPISLDSMLYFACSSVTEQDLSTAETLVKGFLFDHESYFKYLANNATWQKALAQYRKDDYAIIVHKRESADSEKEFVADLIKLTQKTLQEVGMPPFLNQNAIQVP